MKILTVKQPWAWLIVAGLKDIENRSCKTSHRGPLLIQSSARPLLPEDLRAAVAFAEARGARIPDALDYGGVVGIVNVQGCVFSSDSPWFVGPVGWVLADARPLPFVAVRGRQTMFDAPKEVLDALKLPEDSAPGLFA